MTSCFRPGGFTALQVLRILAWTLLGLVEFFPPLEMRRYFFSRTNSCPYPSISSLFPKSLRFETSQISAWFKKSDSKSVKAGTRDPTLDIAKCLGMIFVFIVHAVESSILTDKTQASDMVVRTIHSFNIPMFFIISGIYLPSQNKGFVNYVKDRFFVLIVPATFFVLISTLVQIAYDGLIVGALHPVDYVKMALSPLVGFPLTSWACWFMFCLFTTSLLVNFLRFQLCLGPLSSMSLTAIAGVILLKKSDSAASFMHFSENFWFIYTAPLCCFFLLFGLYFKKTLPRLIQLPFSIRLVASLALLGAAFVTAPLNTGPFSGGQHFVILAISSIGTPIWFFITALLGSLGVLLLSSCLRPMRFLAFMGQYNLTSIFFAGLFFTFGNRLILHLYSGPYIALFASLFGLFSYLFSLPIVVMLSKMFPQLLGNYYIKGPILPALGTKGSPPQKQRSQIEI